MNEPELLAHYQVKNVPGPLETPCALWGGGTIVNGYGQLKWEGRNVYAHRVVFMLRHGYWPNVCRHRCDVMLCVNADHLLDGTHADNVRDRVTRGRTVTLHGEANSQSKLTEDDVRDIRGLRDMGLTQQSIADQFGINQCHVSDIVNRKKWAHVHDEKGPA